MSISAENHVKKLRAGDFAQSVLLFLASCHNSETGQCNPSRETIREFFSTETEQCTLKRVDRALAKLRALGFISSKKVVCKHGVKNWYAFPGLEETGGQTDGVDPTVGVNPIVGVSPHGVNGVDPTVGARGRSHGGGCIRNKKGNDKEIKDFSSLPTPESQTSDLFDGEKMGSSNNSSKSSSKTERSLADLDEEIGLKSSSNKDNASADDAEQKPEKAKKQKAVFCTTERPDDVDPDLWNDFITHRKAKRAPVTATVIKRMRSAATECQMTLSQAMEMTVTRGWQGFEARYVLKDRKESAGTRKLPAHKDPTIKFDDDYYNQRVDPNDIWGFLK